LCAGLQGPLQLKGFPVLSVLVQGLGIHSGVPLNLTVVDIFGFFRSLAVSRT
jgi:hypothetical protein